MSEEGAAGLDRLLSIQVLRDVANVLEQKRLMPAQHLLPAEVRENPSCFSFFFFSSLPPSPVSVLSKTAAFKDLIVLKAAFGSETSWRQNVFCQCTFN